MVNITKNKSENSFAWGVALLTASAVIVKLIGVCYKIPLVHLLGSEGMGYFNAAYDVYAMLCIISTTGLPVAISVIINKFSQQHKHVLWLSLSLVLPLGLLGAVLVFLFAETIAIQIGAPQAAQSLRFISPAVLFICVSGALRGYYQGKRNMVPTAVSQIIEAAGKLLFGLLFARLAIHYNNTCAYAAASFAVLGLSVGTLCCMIFLFFCNKKEETVITSPPLKPSIILSDLLKVAFPVTLGAALSGLSKMIDLGLVMRRLQDAGFSQSMSVSMYGCYSAMVIPLFSAIPSLFGSIAMPVVSHLSHAVYKGDTVLQTQILNISFRLSAALSIPASLGMGMLSDHILKMLFPSSAEQSIAIPLLILMSMSIPASCMISTTSAILQAYGHAWIPMVSTALGAILKAMTLYLLAGNPRIGIMAAPISTLLCCTLIACINLCYILKFAPAFSFVKPWLTTMILSFVSIGAASVLKHVMIAKEMPGIIIVLLTVLTAGALYVILGIKFKILQVSDFKSKIKRTQKNYGNSKFDFKSAL